MGPEILISIVIPVKNGDYWLQDTLTAITQQTLFSQCEIIIIDSGSTDDSIKVISKFPVKLIQIPPGEFNHGETRNLGARAARGKYIVMTVQDAMPANEYWLEKLVEGFDDDKVAGVCGQQIVPHRKDMNPVQWFRPQSSPQKLKYNFTDPKEFNRLSPAEKKRICGWDNVNAMYRKDIFLKLPFKKMVFGEDGQWAKDVLLEGYTIVYNNIARVYHYHYEKPGFTFKRMFSECYLRYRLFGYTYSRENILIPFLKDCKILVREKKVGFLQKFNWLLYNYRIRNATHAAVKEFNKSVARGDDYLDREYLRICGISPMASKPSGK